MQLQLNKIKDRYQRISTELENSDNFSDTAKMRKLSREATELKDTVKLINKYETARNAIRESEELLDDPELKETAEEELRKLRIETTKLKRKLELALIPKDPRDYKNVIIEIRAGAGGDESALFAADLFRMYARYAEEKKWKHEILSSTRIGIGGFKEIIFELKGKNVFARMKYESGVHRVQRVPETEKAGRIHTSTATVAVMPEAKNDSDIKIKTDEIRVDVFRSSGAGGQHVNKTESAVRITHLPTNIVVSCQTGRSQLANREKAMGMLIARLQALEEERKARTEGDMRRSQVGTGDRSEKIRTYNFPQDRITDHRIKFTTKNLSEVINGKLDPIIDKLIEEDQKKKLEKA